MAEFKTLIGKSPLQQLLEDINFQRTKEMRQLLKDGKIILLAHSRSITTYFHSFLEFFSLVGFAFFLLKSH
jgi:hypothetical protein